MNDGSTKSRVWRESRAAKIVLWTAYVAVLIQLTGWIYFELEVSRPIEGYGYPVGLFVPHETLDYIYRPNFEGRFNGAAYGDIPIEINEIGFRDGPIPVAKPGTLRLAVLGDSVVFGSGARKEERFTELLERDPPAGIASLEAINMSVNSYTFAHYLSLAELDFMKVESDFVLVGITLNDNAAREDAWPARNLEKNFDSSGASGSMARFNEWVSRLAGARLLRDIKEKTRFALMNADEKEAYTTKWMRGVVEQWETPEARARFREEVLRFRRVMRSQGRPFAFLVFPELNEILAPEAFGAPRARILALSRELGITSCDAFPAFAAASTPEDLFLYGDSIHFSREGHELLRDVVTQCVKDGSIPLE